jgi:hypothetical protein
MQRTRYVAGITASDKIVYVGFMCSYGKAVGNVLHNWKKVEDLHDSKIVCVFRRGRKITRSDNRLRHICPSVLREQLGSYWTDYHEILYFSIIFKKLSRDFSFH